MRSVLHLHQLQSVYEIGYKVGFLVCLLTGTFLISSILKDKISNFLDIKLFNKAFVLYLWSIALNTGRAALSKTWPFLPLNLR